MVSPTFLFYFFQGMKALSDQHDNDSFIWFQYFKHLIYSHLFWTQRSQSPSGWVKLGHFWISSCLHISPIRGKVWVAVRWEVSSGVKVADQCTRSHKGYSCDKNVQSSHIQASAAWVNAVGENRHGWSGHSFFGILGIAHYSLGYIFPRGALCSLICL